MPTEHSKPTVPYSLIEPQARSGHSIKMSFDNTAFEAHHNFNYLENNRVTPLKIKFFNDSHITQAFQQNMNDLNKEMSADREIRRSVKKELSKDVDSLKKLRGVISVAPYSDENKENRSRPNHAVKPVAKKVEIPKVPEKKPLPEVLTRKQIVEQLVAESFVDPYVPTHQYGPDHVIAAENLSTSAPTGAVKLRASKVGNVAERPVSVVTFMQRAVEKYPHHPALSVKRDGSWVTWNYTEYWNDVRTAAKGFIKLGLEPFKSVGILGFNSPEWFFADLGSIFAGGFAAGVYTTNSPEACQHVLADAAANIIVVENEAQLKKILKIRSQLPNVKAIIQYSGEPTAPNVLSWSDLMEIGKSVPEEVLERRIKGLAVNQCCTLIYTSGTTGNAKGVMLSHDNLTYTSTLPAKVWNIGEGKEKSLSFLPLSHVAAQVTDLYVGIYGGGHVYFAQPDALKGSLVDTLKEVRPTFLLGVPRVWEKIADRLRDVERNLPPFRKALFSWARSLATKYNMNRMKGSNSTPLLFPLANKFVLKKIQQALGFDQLSKVFSGAAPIHRDVLDYFVGLNCVISETFGMSESTGPQTLNLERKFRLGSVGLTLSGLETKIDHPDADGNGEICMNGRNVFMGYINMEDKTEDIIDNGGWLHSGDIGRIDEDGFVFITGRIKELIITAGGENVAPVPIEDNIKEELPIISNCMLIGDKCKFLSMLLTLKTETDNTTSLPGKKLEKTVVDWCRSLGCTVETVDHVLEGPHSKTIMEAIQQAFNRANAKAVSNAQRVQKWTILSQDFSIPAGELGPTMKLKRPVVVKKYKDVIDRIYSDC